MITPPQVFGCHWAALARCLFVNWLVGLSVGWSVCLLVDLCEKSRIRETKHLSTDADSSTDAIGGWTKAKSAKKKLFFARQYKTTSKQKCSSVRPLLSNTFPQGFRISKNIGYPTSRSRMSNILTDSESLGKSNGKKRSQIWTFLFENCRKSRHKKKFFSSLFSIFFGFWSFLTVFLPPLAEVGCPIFLEMRNPWGKVMERSGLRYEHFCLKIA